MSYEQPLVLKPLFLHVELKINNFDIKTKNQAKGLVNH